MHPKRNLLEITYLLTVLGIYAFLYYLNNNYQFFNVWHVPRTFIDMNVEFSPYWIWIYLIAYVLPVFMFFYLKRYQLHLFYLNLFLVLTLITNVCFFLFPSYIERQYVAVGSVDPLTKLAFDILFDTDKPFTCFPSTHVSTSFVAAFTLIKRRIPFFIFTKLALLISFSTLAIGQHYIYDALSGFAVAWFSFYLCQKMNLFQMEENEIMLTRFSRLGSVS